MFQLSLLKKESIAVSPWTVYNGGKQKQNVVNLTTLYGFLEESEYNLNL